MKGQTQEVKGRAGRVKVLQGRRSEGEDLMSQRRRIPTQVHGSCHRRRHRRRRFQAWLGRVEVLWGRKEIPAER